MQARDTSEFGHLVGERECSEPFSSRNGWGLDTWICFSEDYGYVCPQSAIVGTSGNLISKNETRSPISALSTNLMNSFKRILAGLDLRESAPISHRKQVAGGALLRPLFAEKRDFSGSKS